MKYKSGRNIALAEMAPHVHNFGFRENKVEKIVEWLKLWIDKSLQSEIISQYDLLPSKAEFAYHVGVSLGTMQAVFRKLEDFGYVESKQRIGTYIKTNNQTISIEKLTSKKDIAVEAIKVYIMQNNYEKGDIMPSSRNLSKITNFTSATILLALNYLVSTGVLKKSERNYIVEENDFVIKNIKPETLVNKIADKIAKYIKANCKAGDKLPSNNEFASLYGVSIKTIRDAIKLLSKSSLIYTRRGQYGTIVAGEQNSKDKYCYEKADQNIRSYIIENCKAGDKLPSISKLAQQYNTSTKTIKKALDDLASEGFITYMRGRYGGTFVMDIPQKSKEAYQWLALDSNYIAGE